MADQVIRVTNLPEAIEVNPEDIQIIVQGGITKKATAAVGAAPAIEAADQAALDAIQTAADRVATGEDAIQTAADRVQTGLDKVATGEDAIQTAADRVQTGLDRVATGEDAIQTAADRVQTGLDRVATGEDAIKAESWAEEIEDVEVEVGKYSAKHHAIKADASATAAAGSAAPFAGLLSVVSDTDDYIEFMGIAPATVTEGTENITGAIGEPLQIETLEITTT